jgi:TRAP-type transport system periplasmic protein
MNRVAVKFGLAAAALLLATPATTTPAAAQQEIQLTVASGQPLRAMVSLGMVESFFMPEVEKRMAASGLDKKYKIVWKTAWAGSLLKPTQVLEGTRDGITDIGFEPTIFHPDKLPLEQISFVTPFATSNVVQVGKALDALHASIPEFKAQYDKFNVVRLGGSSFDSYELFTTKPVKTFADIKGMKIATAGAALQWLRGTPATPVQSNMTLYYNSAKTGVVDGFIIFPSAIPGMKFPEAAPYVTKVGFGAQYAAALIINKTVAADQRTGEAGDAGFKSVPSFSGGTPSEFAREEQTKWANAMPNIAKEWAANMEKQGLPGNKALATYMEEIRKAGAKPVRDWDKN